MGFVISVINQKGGVGKTTTAVNLATYLAEEGHRTLLIDEDAQGNATSGLTMDSSRYEKALYDVLIGGLPAKEAVYRTKWKRLFLLPASIDLAGAEIEMANMEDWERLLSRAVKGLREDFDFIIIDCPPSLGLMTVNALTAADAVIIPIQAEFYALEGLSQLVKTVNIVKKRLNPELEILGILLTMFDGRTNLAQQVEEEVKSYFGKKVFRTVIPRAVKLSEAPSFGEPISAYAPKSKGAAAYKSFCQEVLKRV